MKLLHKIFGWLYRHTKHDLFASIEELNNIRSYAYNVKLGEKVKLYPLYQIINSKIGNFTYIAPNSKISHTTIGNFCSIGPNFLCGWGIHPINGVSTNPMFYSTKKQNGITLSNTDKIEERKPINIGHDVFIGANVTIIDGVKIGDGAVIGAGAVVTEDIPDFAIAVGVPAKVKKYRFSPDLIKKIKQTKWWEETDLDKLKLVEKYFFDIEKFIEQWEKPNFQ